MNDPAALKKVMDFYTQSQIPSAQAGHPGTTKQ
jgi:hypothetical protein